MGASVVTMAIMVAMFGMIMPEPFDMPPTVNVTPSKPSSSPEKLTAYSFGCVSVVMIARAAEAPPSRLASASAWGTPVLKGSRGRCCPMTPVDATSTSSSVQPTASAVMRAISRACSSPGTPVAAFAMPEFTTTARAVP